ncbi:uncharacterized protein LOC120144746 [Hibiscus syriacus]|uniref:uncharacterized protein LOC120144746 n=1 Tax=Hibiscus syriacus TaxID=106335 RepID=UPI0019234C75|nr:uncharacterized protein LOC120144746 [Hibiscus syriacus]
MTKTTAKDEWVREAMTNDNVVVEFLVRLKQTQDASRPPKSAVAALRWGMRQPRSRPTLMACDAKIDGGDFNVGSRGSPTTPLSWSGGGGAASPLAADGFEETCSSHLRGSPPAAPSRSKGTTANEATSTSTKRSRKKTFAELKEEENRLLEESVYLKRVLDEFKWVGRIDTKTWSSNVDGEEKIGSGVVCNPSTLPIDERKPMPDLCKAGCSEQESVFLLPDLNMMPCEDD